MHIHRASISKVLDAAERDSLHDPDEAAHRLDVEVRTLLRWRKQGRIPSIRLSTMIRFRRSDIDRIIALGLPPERPTERLAPPHPPLRREEVEQ